MAKNTGAVKHTHKYFRRRDGLWACAGIDGCTHYMPKNMAPLPVGMQTRCWDPNCNNEFMLTPVDMENDKPMCETCAEENERINAWLDTQNIPDRPTGLAAFGAKRNFEDPVKKALKQIQEQKDREEAAKKVIEDQVEVIEDGE